MIILPAFVLYMAFTNCNVILKIECVKFCCRYGGIFYFFWKKFNLVNKPEYGDQNWNWMFSSILECIIQNKRWCPRIKIYLRLGIRFLDKDVLLNIQTFLNFLIYWKWGNIKQSKLIRQNLAFLWEQVEIRNMKIGYLVYLWDEFC